MSGIAGWVDFSRDVARERDVVQAMTATLVRRGPDGAGLWCAEHAGLGHRRSGDGERLPRAFDDGSGPRVVTYGGHLHNVEELRGLLRSAGHDLGEGTEADVVLHAYLEWGPDFVARLQGTYAIALWDARRQELLLVRDRMGVKPLFYAPTPAGVLFGSEPKAVLAHPGFRAAVDADGLRDILSVARVPGHAVFRGLREVLPGGLVRVTRSGLTETRYWQLRVAEHSDDLEQTIATVRELLEASVVQHLGSEELPCSLLSGGLDSSSLTALAASAARDQGREPLRSLAVNDHDPTAAAGAQGNEDHVYARLMADHAGTRHSEVSLLGLDLLDPELRASVLAAYDVPLNKGDQYASLRLLFGAAREHAAVALSGEVGDDVFGGYNWNRLPQWVSSDTFPWVDEGRPRFRGNDAVFDPELLGELDLASYERDCHSSAVAEISAGDHIDDPDEARYREVAHLAHTRHTRVLFDRLDRLGMAAGLDIRVPFADPRLVEYAFNIPWAMKSFDGREKSLLRAAMKGLLPEAVSMRVKTPYPNLRSGAYDQVLRERLAAVVRDPLSPAAPLLSSALRKAVAERGAAGLDVGVSRAVLETALQLDSWLRTYGVRLDL
ncbi:asparagine synthase (glutamine-hydrolyzing) [Streptomyces sp. NBC_00038]|uniref:asparagine synthase (glutamine-hydrolyzing) n=1 Tax=Streptomyces sp. NBC_00038 TaxID=2903615 RepID=UPI002251DE02|nr:asparagine synthase (glutamine-hydrolyzing) [Streptomyces sp. NBC_00038]MCX5560844.1 asparagine synthase (glutamine-hydrolyzing) [Streptomyces sp. NBC_00038]